MEDYGKLVCKKLQKKQEWTQEELNWYRSEKLIALRYTGHSADWTACCVALGVILISFLLFCIMTKIK